jgi:hypothetical protein
MPSSSRQAVFTPNAPGPYPALSQAVIHNGFVFTAGSLGTDPATKSLVKGTIADRTVSHFVHTFQVLQLTLLDSSSHEPRKYFNRCWVWVRQDFEGSCLCNKYERCSPDERGVQCVLRGSKTSK